MMLNLQKLIIDCFVEDLQVVYQRTYGILEHQFSEILIWVGRLALENIANSDALYHDVEHTIMVTSVGQAILAGKHLREGGVSPHDWLHFTIALLCHDIGYVKGVCRADTDKAYATGVDGKTVKMLSGGTDAALTRYHVDRGKLFIRERFGEELLSEIDPERIVSYIEGTRLPSPEEDIHESTRDYPGLLRAADYIGQLGDPNYLQKMPALFYEFEETGANKNTGFTTPGDMREHYATFYWKVVRPYIQDALHYLRVTQEGKQWIANLHSHVFDVEHHTM